MFLVLYLFIPIASTLILRGPKDFGHDGHSIAYDLANGKHRTCLNPRDNSSYRKCVSRLDSLAPCFLTAAKSRHNEEGGFRQSAFHVIYALDNAPGRPFCASNVGYDVRKNSALHLKVYDRDPPDDELDYSDMDIEGDTGLAEGYSDRYGEEYDEDQYDYADSQEDSDEISAMSEEEKRTSGRFGAPKFLESTSQMSSSASERMRDLFNWSQDDEMEAGAYDDQAPMGKSPLHSIEKHKDEDILDIPYVIPRKVNMSLDKWPDNCFLRIRLVSYYPYLLRFASNRLIRGIKEHTNLRVGNVKAMPMRKKRWCLLSSPHVDKRSKDLFEIQEHVRYLDVFPVASKSSASSEEKENEGNTSESKTKSEDVKPASESRWMDVSSERSANLEDKMKFKGILMVPLPSMVSFDYWFEEVHKPVKNRSIERQFRRRIWVSKYFLYNYEKREKAEIIDKLTSPELYKEIPLRWKKHPCDYFSLQLGELKKLYNFVVARKAEDEARERYGVKMPELYDIDEVRFVPNEEDRRCGYISSDDDVDEEIAKQLAALDNDN